MILVTGSTGHFGKTAIEFLLKKAPSGQIAALARDLKKAANLIEKGIDVRRGDYFDYASLVKAFQAVDKLLFVSSSEIENRVGQHTNVINAAREAGVKHIIYTSVINPPEDPYFKPALDHIETEKLIEESGLTYTILRNAFYFETIPMLIGDPFQSGKIAFPAGDGVLSDASRIDMAEAAANVLTSDGHENKVYEIGANTSFSFQDIADTLSELLGEKIEYVDVPLEAWKEQLLKNQTPPPVVDALASGAEAIKHNQLNYPSPDLENLLGRKPIGLKEFLKRAYLN